MLSSLAVASQTFSHVMATHCKARTAVWWRSSSISLLWLASVVLIPAKNEGASNGEEAVMDFFYSPNPIIEV